MPKARATGYLVPVLLLSLEPAPDEVSLPKPELPPLPASPPEPGRAVPLVAARPQEEVFSEEALQEEARAALVQHLADSLEVLALERQY